MSGAQHGVILSPAIVAFEGNWKSSFQFFSGVLHHHMFFKSSIPISSLESLSSIKILSYYVARTLGREMDTE